MNDLNEEEVNKGVKVTMYFYDKYGEKKCKFIMSRIATAVKKYDLTTMIELGEKIALFNGWLKDTTALKKLHELNK